MAEPLKNQFGPEVPRTLAGWMAGALPGFDQQGFVEAALDGYDALELLPRAWQVARALRPFLPPDDGTAIDAITRSVEPALAHPRRSGMAGFVYLPLTIFVGEYGLEAFEASMRAQHVLTRLFTAEFGIRPFLVHRPEETLARLTAWTRDPDPHVRRLVSEGTRPRLPWAPRLTRFVEDPAPVLALLGRLRDDPEDYVRRSVANNLNDISRDHPGTVLRVCRDWMPGAGAHRRALIRRALRTLVKQGDPEAPGILGFSGGSPLEVEARLSAREVAIGDTLRVDLRLRNPGAAPERGAVDLRVHFVKANGELRPRVFKGVEVELAPGEERRVRRTISLRQHTTRTHHPGGHALEVVVNGEPRPPIPFLVRPAPAVGGKAGADGAKPGAEGAKAGAEGAKPGAVLP